MANIFNQVADFLKNTASGLISDKKVNIKQFNDFVANDYFRSYLFTVDIIGSFLSSPFNCQWVSSTQTPVMTTSVQNIDYMHTQIKQSGRTIPQQWQVNVRDDGQQKAYKFFNNWRSLIYPKIVGTTPERYKANVDITLMTPTLEKRVYHLFGVWPFEIGAIQLDYDSENISIFPVTLSFDYFDTAIVKGNVLVSIAEEIAGNL